MKKSVKSVAWARKAIATNDVCRVFLNYLVARDGWLIGCDGFRGHVVRLDAADGFYTSHRNRLTERYDSIISRYRPVAVRHEEYPAKLIHDTVLMGYYDSDARNITAIEYAGTAVPEGQRSKQKNPAVGISRVTLDRGAPVYVQAKYMDDLNFAPDELVFSPRKNAVVHLSSDTAGFVLCASVDGCKLAP